MAEQRIVTALSENGRTTLAGQMALLASRGCDVADALLAEDDTRACIATVLLGESWPAVERLAEVLQSARIIKIPDDAAELEP